MVSRRLDVVSYLGSQVLFQNMPEAELQRIAAASIVRRLPRGTEIFAAGDTCEGLYLVVDGMVKLYAKGPQGHEKVIEVVGEGGCVTEALLFSDCPHSVNASALSDLQLVEVPRAVLMSVMLPLRRRLTPLTLVLVVRPVVLGIERLPLPATAGLLPALSTRIRSTCTMVPGG